ncbi:hypothetical protein QVD17_20166 [Tagetes erecta]|uniref:Uncharacterized protein n=1 Tax=Tagetes erecta TaxID=13708 RepID=A0AAD8KL71_TARER|nr:hypothetical protein QVD17_20166 [Tagetes erecta]
MSTEKPEINARVDAVWQQMNKGISTNKLNFEEEKSSVSMGHLRAFSVDRNCKAITSSKEDWTRHFSIGLLKKNARVDAMWQQMNKGISTNKLNSILKKSKCLLQNHQLLR